VLNGIVLKGALKSHIAGRWHSDHVYKHESAAILNFWLLSLVAHNVFKAYFLFNLKPAVQAEKSMVHISRMILRDLYDLLFVNHSGYTAMIPLAASTLRILKFMP
jgi:IS4 transposase